MSSISVASRRSLTEYRVVNEGGLDTLLSVSLIVFIGAIASNLVCFIIWPQSATVNLQSNMTKTLDSFSTLLRMLTNTFLLEEPLHQPSHEKLQSAIENHQSGFTSLKKNLADAYSEWFHGGPTGDHQNSSGRAYEDAVDSLNRLAQHLNGLRSGTKLQYDLTKAHADGKVVLKNRSARQNKGIDATANNASASGSNGHYKAAVNDGQKFNEQSEEEDALLQAAALMFGDLVDDLGPPMKALSVRSMQYSAVNCSLIFWQPGCLHFWFEKVTRSFRQRSTHRTRRYRSTE